MTDYRPPYKAAVLAGFGAWVLYVLTLSPSTAMWDTSEYIATAYILGIPHPPGNPLFVVLAKSWSLLLSPLGLPVAVRINLLAATTSAAAAGFYFLVAHRILWGFVGGTDGASARRPASTPEARKGDDEGESADVSDGRRVGGTLPLVGAAVAVLLSATAFTVWNQSTVNEKVYTISVVIIAAVVWLGIRWYDKRDDPGGIRYLLGALYLMALGSTNHLMSVLPLPAMALFVVMVAPGVLLTRRFWTRGIALLILGLSLNFFLPIRAAQDPVINEGDPTCDSAVGRRWRCTPTAGRGASTSPWSSRGSSTRSLPSPSVRRPSSISSSITTSISTGSGPGGWILRSSRAAAALP